MGLFMLAIVIHIRDRACRLLVSSAAPNESPQHSGGDLGIAFVPQFRSKLAMIDLGIGITNWLASILIA